MRTWKTRASSSECLQTVKCHGIRQLQDDLYINGCFLFWSVPARRLPPQKRVYKPLNKHQEDAFGRNRQFSVPSTVTPGDASEAGLRALLWRISWCCSQSWNTFGPSDTMFKTLSMRWACYTFSRQLAQRSEDTFLESFKSVYRSFFPLVTSLHQAMGKDISPRKEVLAAIAREMYSEAVVYHNAAGQRSSWDWPGVSTRCRLSNNKEW